MLCGSILQLYIMKSSHNMHKKSSSLCLLNSYCKYSICYFRKQPLTLIQEGALKNNDCCLDIQNNSRSFFLLSFFRFCCHPKGGQTQILLLHFRKIPKVSGRPSRMILKFTSDSSLSRFRLKAFTLRLLFL